MTFAQPFHFIDNARNSFEFYSKIEHVYHAIGEWHNFGFHEIQFDWIAWNQKLIINANGGRRLFP